MFSTLRFLQMLIRGLELIYVNKFLMNKSKSSEHASLCQESFLTKNDILYKQWIKNLINIYQKLFLSLLDVSFYAECKIILPKTTRCLEMEMFALKQFIFVLHFQNLMVN